MDNTYIKLFRNLLNWEWYQDANTVRVFIHILLKVNYEPSKFKGHEIGRGECVFGYSACAKDLKLTVQQVRTAIKHLKSTGEITTKVTNKFSIVRVEKWDLWQLQDGRATSKTTDKRPNKQQATNKQLTASKENKKLRNKEIIINDLRTVDDVVADFWARRG